MLQTRGLQNSKEHVNMNILIYISRLYPHSTSMYIWLMLFQYGLQLV